MRLCCAALWIGLLLAGSAAAAERPAGTFDWDAWRRLPVQDGGRQKPLDTLAWETLRTLCNRGSFADPQTGRTLDPTALYLTMLFDRQGGNEPESPHGMSGMESRGSYFASHQPDKWDRAGLLRVDYLQLRRALGMAADQKYLSPLELSRAKIRDPATGRSTPFLAWAQRLLADRQQGFSIFERKALELADNYWSYLDHRMGRRLEVIPVQGSRDAEWIAVADLVRTRFDDRSDPSGKMRQAQEQFREARAAFRAGSAAEFNRASAAFLQTVRLLGPTLGDYPRQAIIDLEVAYNHWAPFRFAWALTLLGFVCALLSMATRWRLFYVSAMLIFAAGVAAMLIGFAMRIAISGRAPVTNMYESVIYVGLGVAILGLVLELVYRRRYILTAAAAVCTVTLLLADNSPTVLDPGLHPLQPVLRSNFWLISHVMSITLSYAAFALALGISNITLGYYLAGSRDRETIRALSVFTYRALQVGVLLLAAGTILGGVWADYSWGRFWGWDPKEVWALIALLCYLAVLHARSFPWVGDFGLAALSTICFSLVVMAWYGVNFVLGAGLHSYGFGGGGQEYVYAALIAQFLYVAAAGVRVLWLSPGPPAQEQSLPARAGSLGDSSTATRPSHVSV